MSTPPIFLDLGTIITFDPSRGLSLHEAMMHLTDRKSANRYADLQLTTLFPGGEENLTPEDRQEFATLQLFKLHELHGRLCAGNLVAEAFWPDEREVASIPPEAWRDAMLDPVNNSATTANGIRLTGIRVFPAGKTDITKTAPAVPNTEVEAQSLTGPPSDGNRERRGRRPEKAEQIAARMETDYAGRLADLWGDENGKNSEKQEWLAHRYDAARSTIVRAIGIVKSRH